MIIQEQNLCRVERAYDIRGQAGHHQWRLGRRRIDPRRPPRTFDVECLGF